MQTIPFSAPKMPTQNTSKRLAHVRRLHLSVIRSARGRIRLWTVRLVSRGVVMSASHGKHPVAVGVGRQMGASVVGRWP